MSVQRGQDPAMKIVGLRITYGGRPVLEGVDLEIASGCVTAFLGPSGCGKTSLLQCLNRLCDLVPGCQAEGSIWWDGQDILGRDADVSVLRRSVGMVFQRPNPFPLSIRANLHLPLRDHGCHDRREREAVAVRVLEEVGLWEEVRDRLDDPALTLSGGQQQRLCMARALTLEPRILLMDEPCSALDPVAAARIEDLIRELRGRYTIVVVTHDLAQARRLADQVAVFWVHGGVAGIVDQGAAERVFTRPRNAEVAAWLEGRRPNR